MADGMALVKPAKPGRKQIRSPQLGTLLGEPYTAKRRRGSFYEQGADILYISEHAHPGHWGNAYACWKGKKEAVRGRKRDAWL